jgi:hypothetical protein
MSKMHGPLAGIKTFLFFVDGLPDQFKRKRLWSPQSVMVWLLLLTFPDRKSSYRRSLPLILCFAQKTFGWLKIPSIGSVTRARAKMKPSDCRAVLHTIVERCEQHLKNHKHRYGTRRFIAFDGTRLITRRTADTARKLHRFHRPNGERVHNPQGLMVAAVDVFRRMPLDWVFVGKKTGEKTAMTGLLDTLRLQPGDVALMDRGLPSRKLFGMLLERGVDIVARMSTSKAIAWTEVSEFIKTGKQSGTIDIEIGDKGVRRAITVRLVERPKKKGRPRKGAKAETMMVLTTLRVEDGFSPKKVMKIYGARWGIETLFKELKSFMGIEPMHTGTVDGCEQEICACLIWMALATLLQVEAESTLNGRRVVRADCLRAASDLVREILEGRPITQRIENDLSALRKFCYTTQTDRHAPRECKMPYGRTIMRGG